MTIRFESFKTLAITGACAAGLVSVATASAAQDATSSSEVEEVVVTAQFRAQNIQDVPLSITALTGADLEARGALNLADYARSVPGLTFANRGANRSEIMIRGMSRLTGESTAGFYMDGVPQGNAFNNPDFRLFDIDRIEILRGPQGTLYGEGSLGGTIKVFTTKPRTDRFESKVEGIYATTRDGDASTAANALVNLPVATDRAGLRLSAFHRHDGGYIDNAATGERDINTIDSWGVRGALLFRPNDAIEIQFIVNHQHDEVDNLDVRTVGPGFGRYDAFLPLPLFEEQDNTQYTLLGEFQLGTGKIESMFGYNLVGDNRAVDSTTAGLPAGFETLFTSDGKIFVTEHRFISEFDGPLNFVAGIFYRDRQRTNYLTLPGVGPIFFGVPGDFVNYVDFRTKTAAVFGEAYYVAGPLTVTAGLRYFSENVASPASQTVGALVLDESDTDKTFEKATPKVGVSWKASEDVMVFANIAQGFRSGGTNPTFSADPNYVASFLPDIAWSYEAGIKSQWFDRRLTFNATAFYISWDDLQILGVPTNPALGFTTNAGAASSRGFEVELKARPVERLDLNLGIGYVDAHLDDPAQGAPAGAPLPYISKWTLAGAAQYTWPLAGDWNAVARVDWSWRSKANSDIRQTALGYLPASENINLRLGVETDRYGAFLFANNVTDDLGITVAQASGQYISRPRTVGVNLRAKF